MIIRYKTNKQAIIIAALVILLCLVCLTGATLALFTSDLEDGTIGIVTTAGDIKVDITDAVTGESLVGKTLSFEGENVLFEPGATFFTGGFKVSNVGDIPVNFRLYISDDDQIDMDEFNKAFEVWIATEPGRPDGGEKLTDFVGRLEVGQSSEETYYLFIKMKETVGNEFQGKTYSGIGVTVCAVQGNVNINTKE